MGVLKFIFEGGKWWKVLVADFLIAILLFCVMSVRSCVICHGIVKDAEKAEEAEMKTVSIRYFTEPDINTSKVVIFKVEKGKNFVLSEIPEKSGYMFLGLYDGPDPVVNEIYIDSNGYNLKTVSEDITLYPYYIRSYE